MLILSLKMRKNCLSYLLWLNILFLSAVRAGGKETDLDKFPWVLLLKATFKNDNNLSIFSCGGSLISHLYVLTAAHCIVRPGETLLRTDITHTEYKDNCEVMGRNLNCKDNVLLQAEYFKPHLLFDDEKLRNDIALIRLKEYDGFIQPVCLPAVNIDKLHLGNLPLVVAGWGRNGNHVSDKKEWMMVKLVPHAVCHKAYPFKAISQLCAAGWSDADTRMGDSGGPLMMEEGGSYYIIGVVSGRRANNAVGTTMPSLYTNVFNHIHWIKKNIMKINRLYSDTDNII